MQREGAAMSPAVGWRDALLGSPLRLMLTLALGALLALVLPALIDWALLHAVFRPDAQACRALERSGACWGVVAEKLRPILFGRYPFEQQWRPLMAMLLLGALLAASAWPRCWRVRCLLPAWGAVLPLVLLLMGGGAFGLDAVPTARWGGLSLTLLLTVFGLAAAFPLGVLLALGRRSRWPLVSRLCATYIECVRGVPLISVLFMASFLLPLLLPPGWRLDVLLRVGLGIALFAAAYLAEVVRGGLQAVPPGQWQAGRALGLSEWQLHRDIVLPQALRSVVPALMNSFIGTLKDCSLVSIVGLHELTGSLGLALGGDPDWRPFYLEGYLFIAAVYGLLCFGLSRYSRWVERRLGADPAGRR